MLCTKQITPQQNKYFHAFIPVNRENTHVVVCENCYGYIQSMCRTKHFFEGRTQLNIFLNKAICEKPHDVRNCQAYEAFGVFANVPANVPDLVPEARKRQPYPMKPNYVPVNVTIDGVPAKEPVNVNVTVNEVPTKPNYVPMKPNYVPVNDVPGDFEYPREYPNIFGNKIGAGIGTGIGDSIVQSNKENISIKKYLSQFETNDVHTNDVQSSNVHAGAATKKIFDFSATTTIKPPEFFHAAPVTNVHLPIITPIPVAPTSVAPTPVAPTSVAPTSVAPTSVAPTSVAYTPLATHESKLSSMVQSESVTPTPIAPTPAAHKTDKLFHCVGPKSDDEAQYCKWYKLPYQKDDKLYCEACAYKYANASQIEMTKHISNVKNPKGRHCGAYDTLQFGYYDSNDFIIQLLNAGDLSPNLLTTPLVFGNSNNMATFDLTSAGRFYLCIVPKKEWNVKFRAKFIVRKPLDKLDEEYVSEDASYAPKRDGMMLMNVRKTKIIENEFYSHGPLVLNTEKIISMCVNKLYVGHDLFRMLDYIQLKIEVLENTPVANTYGANTYDPETCTYTQIKNKYLWEGAGNSTEYFNTIRRLANENICLNEKIEEKITAKVNVLNTIHKIISINKYTPYKQCLCKEIGYKLVVDLPKNKKVNDGANTKLHNYTDKSKCLFHDEGFNFLEPRIELSAWNEGPILKYYLGAQLVEQTTLPVAPAPVAPAAYAPALVAHLPTQPPTPVTNVTNTPPTPVAPSNEQIFKTFMDKMMQDSEFVKKFIEPHMNKITTHTNVPTTNVPTTNVPTTNVPTTNVSTTNVPTTNVPPNNIKDESSDDEYTFMDMTHLH